MTYLIVAIVVLMIVAPVFRLLPSKEQKAQMKLRREAMARGINVELVTITDPIPDQERYISGTGRRLDPLLQIMSYKLVRPRPDDRRRFPRTDWALLRQPDGDNRFLGEWCWEEEVELPAELHEFLSENIASLPDDCVKVDDVNYMVSLHWREKSGEVGLASIVNFLEGIKKVTYGAWSDPSAPDG